MSTNFLAKRLNGVSESATLKLNAMVQSMKAQGVDVVNLTAGEPDFNVPDESKVAIRKALDENKSKYTPVLGIPELRAAILEKTHAQQPEIAKQNPWKADEVLVTNGGKQALYNAFMALLNPGEEVLIPSPFWLSYPEMVKLAEGKPVTVDTKFEEGFKLKPETLKRAIADSASRTGGAGPKVLVLNGPGNPTGVGYSADELRALGKVIVEARDAGKAKNLWVISDEIYDRIAFDGKPFVSFGAACPELRDQLITVNGMSKSAAMTGWRIGWSVARKELTSAMMTIQGQCTSGINSLAQWASLAALKLPESAFKHQVESFQKRRDLTLEILGKAGKIKVVRPTGAFYVFVGIGAYLRASEDSMGFAERLLQDAKVAVVPGTPFGAPDFCRLSYATDEASLAKGCERLVEFCLKQEAGQN